MNFQSLYYFFDAIVFILFILVNLGIWNHAPSYYRVLSIIFRLIISFILLYYFNPFFTKINELNKFHRNVAFSGGLYLLASTTIDAYIGAFKGLVDVVSQDVKGVVDVV